MTHFFREVRSLMLASSWSLKGGKRLRALREHLGLTLRDVQQLSRAFADEKQTPDYYIAHSSLADIENGNQEPSIFKLYTLSVIYGYDCPKLLVLCGIPLADAERDHRAVALQRTYLVGPAPEDAERVILPREIREKLRTEPTNLVPKMIASWNDIPATLLQQMGWHKSLYGYVGMKDYTLHPFVRPGSFVEIDPRKKRVGPPKWHNDHERPVFFVELREKYVCTWLERHGNNLILVPSPESGGHVQPVRYPGEATIVGQVTVITMRIAGGRED
jgi:transcriptional regulator with XRE-family HTH domain